MKHLKAIGLLLSIIVIIGLLAGLSTSFPNIILSIILGVGSIICIGAAYCICYVLVNGDI